jgi:hypothetical protein
MARTSVLLPSGGVINLTEKWRPAATVGLGMDCRLDGHLYLTPSIDYTAVLGTDSDTPELRHALAVGIGLTIR